MAAGTDTLISEYVPYTPAAPLRPYVALFSGYREAGVAPALHRGLPSPYLTVIFTLDDPLVMAAHPRPDQAPGTFQTLIGGLHSSPALIAHDGRQSGIQLAVTPLGARALLDMPASELAHIDVHGTEVLGSLAGHIQDGLRTIPDWPSRFAFLEAVLAQRLGAAAAPAAIGAEIGHAWQRLLDSGGTVSVAELAAETGWSDRHLRGRFRAETGLGPKEAARVIRFDQTRRRLDRRGAAGRPLDLAGLASSAGYFDQAHMDREFRQLAGCPPTTWLAEG